eukprot:7385596-Prymnesium_polylepis.1
MNPGAAGGAPAAGERAPPANGAPAADGAKGASPTASPKKKKHKKQAAAPAAAVAPAPKPPFAAATEFAGYTPLTAEQASTLSRDVKEPSGIADK